MSRCSDPRFEHMIHGFELGLLTENDRLAFETHLLECEHCFKEVQEFLPVSMRLRHGIGLSQVEPKSHARPKPVTKAVRAKQSGKGKPWLKSFRILVVSAILAVAIIPIYYYGFRDHGTPQIVQHLDLLPLRGGAAPELYLDRGGIAEIRFVMHSADRETVCRVLISSRSGDEVFRDDHYNQFDSVGVGVIRVPVADFRPGHHTLTIVEPEGSLPVSQRHYNFTVK
jgi:hypothetical protein